MCNWRCMKVCAQSGRVGPDLIGKGLCEHPHSHKYLYHPLPNTMNFTEMNWNVLVGFVVLPLIKS